MKYFYYLLAGIAILVIFIFYIIISFDVTVIIKDKSKDFILTNKGGLRNSCYKCVRKHISQARALIDESKLGYPDHFFLALGHLAEAESESIKEFPDLAKKIRYMRESLYSGGEADLMELLQDVNEIEKNN